MTSAIERRRPVGRTASVLVIDDDPMVLSAARRSLERFGYHVMTAAGGAQGIAEFQENAGRIAAVLLDSNMPGITGPEAFAELRRIDDRVPILITSGDDESTARADFPRDAVAGFIAKPYQGRELAEKIEPFLA